MNPPATLTAYIIKESNKNISNDLKQLARGTRNAQYSALYRADHEEILFPKAS
jgi:hypothetical protein